MLRFSPDSSGSNGVDVIEPENEVSPAVQAAKEQAKDVLRIAGILARSVSKGKDYKANRLALTVLSAIVAMELTAADVKAKDTDDDAILDTLRSVDSDTLSQLVADVTDIASGIVTLSDAKFNDAMKGGITPHALGLAGCRIVMPPKAAALKAAAIGQLALFLS